MIENDHQYLITLEWCARFELELKELDRSGSALHPLLAKSVRDGLVSMARELRAELVEYHKRKYGNGDS